MESQENDFVNKITSWTFRLSDMLKPVNLVNRIRLMASIQQMKIHDGKLTMGTSNRVCLSINRDS